MKVLVIQTAFLGDAVIALSLAEELRRLSPDAHITYLVRPEVAGIINFSPSVNQVLIYDKYNSESGIDGIRKKADELNQENFDIVFTLHNSKRTRMLIERLNAPQIIGYGNYNTLTHKVIEINEPHTTKAIRLLQVIFPDADLRTLPKLAASEIFLPKEVKKIPRPIIALAPDSVWKTKQWGYVKYISLLSLLLNKNYSIIIIGVKESLLEDNDHSTFDNVIDLTSKTSLEELVSVISYCDLLISTDSAPVHIATATRTPNIVIYGPTVPEFGFAPPSDIGQIIQNEYLWCRPCASHGGNECPIHTHECMTSISPQTVFEGAMSMLALRKLRSIT